MEDTDGPRLDRERFNGDRSTCHIIIIIIIIIIVYYANRQYIQEAQLPQRNSVSAAHICMKALHPNPLPLPLATSMRMVESETRHKRTSSVPSTKRTLR